MGADLTIQSTKRYFRDSYGPSNTWWVRGMSYWEMSSVLRRRGLIPTNGVEEVKPAGVQVIWNTLQQHPFPAKDAFVQKWRVDHKDVEIDTVREEVQIEDAWRCARADDAEMIAFWKEALAHNSTVRWSV